MNPTTFFRYFTRVISAIAGAICLVVMIWAYPLTFGIPFFLIFALTIYIVVQIIYEPYFNGKGYSVGHEGRDDVYYRERYRLWSRKLLVSGEMMAPENPHVVYVPADDQWQRQMPHWAKNRKSEILERMKSEFEEHCIFQEH